MNNHSSYQIISEHIHKHGTLLDPINSIVLVVVPHALEIMSRIWPSIYPSDICCSPQSSLLSSHQAELLPVHLARNVCMLPGRFGT